jgi:hypothetical protein
LPSGATVSIYPVLIPPKFSGALSSDLTSIDSFAVTWSTPGGAVTDATIPLTLTITDPAIEYGDNLYLMGTSAQYVVAPSIENGIITVTFSAEELYVVASSQIAQSPLIITSISGHVKVPLELATSGGSGTGAVTYVATNGTAVGCAVSGSDLISTSAGTCLVTATKVADPSYFTQSSPSTAISITQLANPAAVSVNFSKGTSHLSKNAMRSLAALSALLATGAHLVITGYARASGKLARNRATAVEAFVRQRLQITVTFKIEIATSTSAEKVTVISTQP